MTDKDTWSVWDHITGECFKGEYEGHRLEVFPMRITTVEAALHEDPDIEVSFSSYRGWNTAFMKFVHRKKINSKSFLPPPFRLSMSTKMDPRLDKLTQGLGVIIGNEGKYYPMDAIPKGETIEDQWQGRRLRISRGEIDGVPSAVWADVDESAEEDLPMQLLSRWYGFAFTYPGCDIYENPSS